MDLFIMDGGRYDLWGDNLAVLVGEDASYGPLMEGQMVHHWFNMIPEWGDYKGMAPSAHQVQQLTISLGIQ